MPSIDNSVTNFEHCNTLAWLNALAPVSRDEAQLCERSFPDSFVADTFRVRRAVTWHVEHTWNFFNPFRLWK